MPAENPFDFVLHSDAIAAALRGDGWLVLPEFLSESCCTALLADSRQHRAEFVTAAVGRGNTRRQRSDERRDETLWLREGAAVQREFLGAMEHLRSELNRRLFLGLYDYEAHYAHYAPGAFYRRHRDAFAPPQGGAGDPNETGGLNGASVPQRLLTSVIYLNTAMGGELVLWHGEHELARVAPVAGTAVFFLSAEFPHEVLPAQSDRYSIAGWFRAR